MKILRKVANIFDRVDVILAVWSAVLIAFIALATIYEVIMRYFLNSPTGWTVEVSQHALVYITFLGAAWVLRREKHIKIDIVLNLLSPRTRALLNMTTSIIGAIVCLVIVWYGVTVTLESFQIGYWMGSQLRTPQFLIEIVIPVGILFFFIEFLKKSYTYLVDWRNLATAREHRAGKKPGTLPQW